jgi:D-alanyl-D-alanine carboxypeptidase (penicillin-binding protein 5/6)
VSIWDLLYGLMLPSGNDAAVCLAENIGQYFEHGKKTPLDNFVEEMNACARRL